MLTTTRSLVTSFFGMTAGELRTFLADVKDNEKISASVYLAGNDPRESDQLTLTVKVEN